MAWAYFQNQGAWDAYHNAVCADLGIPRPGRNAASGEPAIMACWTDAWVDPIQVKGTGNVTAWVAQIPDEHVAEYGIALSVPDGAVVRDPETGALSFSYGGKDYTVDPAAIAFNWRKSKPPTVTMDNKVYDTSTGAVVG
jgi:hypothetical protein